MSCLNNHCRHYDTVVDALGGVFGRLGAFCGELGISAQLAPDSVAQDPIMVVTLRAGEKSKMAMAPLSQLAQTIASVGDCLADELTAEAMQAAGLDNLKQAFLRHLEETGALPVPEAASEDQPEDDEPRISYCSECGADIADFIDGGASYCPYCGSELP